MNKQLIKTVSVSMIGNLFEWYDFALFGYFAAIIGKLFFPVEDPMMQLIYSYGTFAVGYIARPLGGIIFGHIGDRLGRRIALVLTIILMAVPTMLIGLLPTYDSWGSAAPLTLIFLRIAQGLSMGGNYGGSITFTTEHSDKARRGLVGSLSVTSCMVGILLGSFTAALFTHFFREETLYSWAWRVPFLVGILICLVGFYIRLRIPESPEYLDEVKASHNAASPATEIFSTFRRPLTLMVLVTMLHDVSFYLLLMYMPTYLSEFLHVPKGAAYAINSINLVVVCIITIFAGSLSDRIGRKPIMAGAALMFLLGTVPLMKILMGSPNLVGILFSQMALAMVAGCYFGPSPALMVETYPTRIRYSAIAITTNISGPIFGGATPVLITYIMKLTGSTMIPTYYLVLAAGVSLLALNFLKKGSLSEYPITSR